MLFIVKLYSARLKKYNPIFQWETRLQALDIADEYNMKTVSRNATSTVHEILLLNKGLQTIYWPEGISKYLSELDSFENIKWASAFFMSL